MYITESTYYNLFMQRDETESTYEDPTVKLPRYLNRDDALGKQLRRYVDPWLDAGRDYRRLSPELRGELKRAIRQVRLRLLDQWSEGEKTFKRPYLYVQWNIASTPRGHAVQLFLNLLDDRGGAAERIARCNHCGRYFMRGRKNMKFCSHACATADAIGKSRKDRQIEKLEGAVKRLGGQKPRADWKSWLDKHTGGRGDPGRISKNWLTHKVNEGILTKEGKLTPKGFKAIDKLRRKS